MEKIMFQNQSFEVSELPPIDDMQFCRLSANYYTGKRVMRCLYSVIATAICVALNYFIGDKIAGWMFYAMWSVVGLLSINIVYGYVADQQKGYCLRTHDISYQYGLLFKRIVTQPLCKLQHSEINRSPLERYLGLASIYVFSAGGMNHTFRVPGLPLADAEAIRQLLIDYGEQNSEH